jgi:hypothetical protein
VKYWYTIFPKQLIKDIGTPPGIRTAAAVALFPKQINENVQYVNRRSPGHPNRRYRLLS